MAERSVPRISTSRPRIVRVARTPGTLPFRDNYYSNFLTLDSAQRDLAQSPTPQDYVVRLPTTYYDVANIAIVNAVFPKSDYLVNESNNRIDLDIGGVISNLVVPIGNYTVTTLLAAVQAVLPIGFAVSHNTVTDQTEITYPPNAFTLLWASGANASRSIADLLGFPRNADAGAAAGVTLTSPNRLDLFGERSVILGLSNHLRSDQGLYGALNWERNEIVPPSPMPGGFSQFTRFSFAGPVGTETRQVYAVSAHPAVKPFIRPLDELSSIRIKWYRGAVPGGDMDQEERPLYNFRGMNHTLMLRIDTIEPLGARDNDTSYLPSSLANLTHGNAAPLTLKELSTPSTQEGAPSFSGPPPGPL